MVDGGWWSCSAATSELFVGGAPVIPPAFRGLAETIGRQIHTIKCPRHLVRSLWSKQTCSSKGPDRDTLIRAIVGRPAAGIRLPFVSIVLPSTEWCLPVAG